MKKAKTAGMKIVASVMLGHKRSAGEGFGGMNPTDFFRKLRDETSKKKTW
ncbi:MAG: hypothetical protein HYY37_00730 [Candidatus Aenigmarchaeota archaeon]|nr:hypothetical protein [Candidatus Aenigmarchaeota archaeon]